MVEPTQKKRSGARFNVVDFLIILVLLLCVFSVVARYTTLFHKIGLTRDLEEYEVSFTVSNLRYTTPNFIHINDEIYETDGNKKIGTLLSCEEGSMDALTITLASKYVQSEGGFVAAYYEENSLVDASGRFLCSGRVNDDEYFFLDGDQYLAVGQKLVVYTELVDLEITVTGITKHVAD